MATVVDTYRAHQHLDDDGLCNLLEVYRRNLAQLELEAARHGLSVPVELKNHLEYTKQEIEGILLEMQSRGITAKNVMKNSAKFFACAPSPSLERNESNDEEPTNRWYKGKILDWGDLVKELANQVSKENEEMMLAIDTLSYGEITVPKAYDRFWHELVSKAAADVSIQIVTYNKMALEQLIREEFSNDNNSLYIDIIEKHVAHHLDHIRLLQSLGNNRVDIRVTTYFPLHIFVFRSSKTAMFALQEVFTNGKVRAYAVLTHDPILVEICRQTFEKMKSMAETV